MGALYSGEGGRNRQRQWNAIDTLAIRRNNHDMRPGMDYQRLMPARETAAESMTGRWNSLPALLSGAAPLVLSVLADQASALVETLSAFAQDTWSVTSRLNVTYGVRWELTPAPSMRQPPAVGQSQPPPAFGGTTMPFLPLSRPPRNCGVRDIHNSRRASEWPFVPDRIR